jgi:hypothetical protein
MGASSSVVVFFISVRYLLASTTILLLLDIFSCLKSEIFFSHSRDRKKKLADSSQIYLYVKDICLINGDILGRGIGK